MAHSHPLTDWFKSMGGELHWSLYLKGDSVTGWSFYTSAPLPTNTTLVTVPVSLCISAHVAHSHVLQLLVTIQGPRTVQRFPEFSALPSHDWILLYLVLCRLAMQHLTQHQDDGSWANCLAHVPYVSHIPTMIPTPLHFTEAELKLLSNTTLRRATERRLKKTKVNYVRAAKLLCAYLEPVNHGFALHVKRVLDTKPVVESEDRALLTHTWIEGLELWRWAESVLTSRACPSSLLGDMHPENKRSFRRSSVRSKTATDNILFDGTTDDVSLFGTGDSSPVLIPVYDMFSHEHARRVTWTHMPPDAAPESSPSAKEPQGGVAMVLNYAVPSPDTQVFNNYGDKSNEEFLAGYGFTVPTTSNDAVALKLSLDFEEGFLESIQVFKLGNEGQSKTIYWPNTTEASNPHGNPPCPCELFELMEDWIQNGREDLQDLQTYKEEMERSYEAAEELESLLIERRKEFQKSEAQIEEHVKKHQVLTNVPPTWSPRTSPKQIRASVLKHVRQYRAGQLEILGKAVAWVSAELQDLSTTANAYSSEDENLDSDMNSDW